VAAPTYVNHGTGFINSGTAVTVTKPTGTQTDDYMLVHIQHATGQIGADPTGIPAGWAMIGVRQQNSSSSHWYFEKLAGASEPASWDWTGFAVTAAIQYGIVVFNGVDQTTPLNTTHLLQNTNIAGTTVDLSVITTSADCLLVAFAGQDQAVSNNAWSQASMVELYDETQSTADLSHCAYRETATTAGTYARTLTASVAERISGALIALNPAPAGGVNLTDGRTLTYHMNRLAGTLVNGAPTRSAQAAANIWASTTGLDLVGALNVEAGNALGAYKELDGVLNQLAGTTGLATDGAAASIP